MTNQAKRKHSSRRIFSLCDGVRTLLLLALAVIVTLFEPTLEFGRAEWAIAVAAIGLLMIGAQVLRAWEMSRNRTLGELHELFVYLIISLIAGSAVLYLDQVGPLSSTLDLRLGSSASSEPDWMAMAVASVLFVMSFAPLILAFIKIERRQKREKKNQSKILRDDIVSIPSLVITAIVLASIFTLAWAAGSGRFELGRQINVLTMAVVVGGFLAIIFVPNMVRAWNDWIERREALTGPTAANGVATLPMSFLSVAARGVSYFDSILVRIFAPLSGATQKGFMVAHLLVLLVIVPLSAMGFVLAAPFGLIPISLAALIALALGRRWAWVEDDRETASRLQSTDPGKADIKVGFDDDLKDEALLGYASLFVLVPLALYQIQGAMGVFEATSASTGNPFIDWLSFFGAELAKAVPFVDWWEIYNVDVQVPFEASAGAGGEWARHLTFAARAIVDLVIMAALFQALTIWQRSRTQKKLYSTGELNAFDPFTEEDFFERGMHKPYGADTLQPKPSFERKIEAHVKARKQLNFEPLPYSRERLGELIKRTRKDDLSLGAEWMIKTYDVLAGEPREQLRQLAQRWNTIHSRERFQGNALEDKAWVREQKRELERILDGLLRDTAGFRGPQIGCLAECLSAVHQHPEFAYARLLSFELLCERETGKSAALLGCHVLKEDWPEELRDQLKRRFSVHLGMPRSLYLGQGRMRAEVLLALASQYPRQGMYARAMIEELLTGASQHDRDASVRQKAAALLSDLN
jgi:hypothetical protein